LKWIIQENKICLHGERNVVFWNHFWGKPEHVIFFQPYSRYSLRFFPHIEIECPGPSIDRESPPAKIQEIQNNETQKTIEQKNNFGIRNWVLIRLNMSCCYPPNNISFIIYISTFSINIKCSAGVSLWWWVQMKHLLVLRWHFRFSRPPL